MIQDIAPRVFDPVYREKKPEPDDYVLHYSFNKVMLLRQGRPAAFLHSGIWKGKGTGRQKPIIYFPLMGGPIT